MYKGYLVNGYYDFLVKNRTNVRGGGVMIQVKEHVKILKQLETPFEESIFAEVEKNFFRLKIGVVYYPPRTNKLQFVNQLEDFLEMNNSTSEKVLICGDFNINTLLDNQLSTNYINGIISNGFEIFGIEPTRVSATSSTCIDHFIYKNLSDAKTKVMQYEEIADHYPILIIWPVKQISSDSKHTFRDTNFLKYKSKLSFFLKDLKLSFEANENGILLMEDPEQAFDSFQSIFEKVINRYAPIKKINPSKKPRPPWFNNALRNLRTKRNKAHRNWKKTLKIVFY